MRRERKFEVSPCDGLPDADGVSRRDFLRAGSLTVVGLSRASKGSAQGGFSNRHAILIVMTGGPSQLETFDPKPDAPSQIRGPFKSIQTAIPGSRFGESLPELAKRADRLAVIRTLCHEAAPIHETGLQLLQTGRLCQDGLTFPHWGSLVARSAPPRSGVAANLILPRILSETGVRAYRGQSAGLLGQQFEPVTGPTDAADESDSLRRHYGDTPFGRLFLKARQSIERGTRCVTLNLFDSLHNQMTWDCHADPNCGSASLFDYQSRLCPEFDQAMSGLMDDLSQRGLLDETLIIAAGEMGRMPRVNENMGRDHWTGCWSALAAGAGIKGGVLVGRSDASAAEPADRPTSPGEITATLLHWLGVDVASQSIQFEKCSMPLVPHAAITELWG